MGFALQKFEICISSHADHSLSLRDNALADPAAVPLFDCRCTQALISFPSALWRRKHIQEARLRKQNNSSLLLPCSREVLTHLTTTFHYVTHSDPCPTLPRNLGIIIQFLFMNLRKKKRAPAAASWDRGEQQPLSIWYTPPTLSFKWQHISYNIN